MFKFIGDYLRRRILKKKLFSVYSLYLKNPNCEPDLAFDLALRDIKKLLDVKL